MAAEPQPLPVRYWLLFLARTAASEVGVRLEQAGYVTRSRLPGRPARLVPADRDGAFAPRTGAGYPAYAWRRTRRGLPMRIAASTWTGGPFKITSRSGT
jgi:hypothetical protein